MCPKFKLCVFIDPGYGGNVLVIGKRGLSNKIYDEAGFNDAVSSVKNRRNFASKLHPHLDAGPPVCLDPGRKVPDLSVFESPYYSNGNFDEDASSSRNSKKQSCPS